MHGVITELPRATIDKCNLLVLSKNYVRKKLERVNGIEPSSLAWEARVITIIRHPQYVISGNKATIDVYFIYPVSDSQHENYLEALKRVVLL